MMSPDLVQTAIVGLVALAAAAVVIRRVLGFASRDAAPRCASCASNEAVAAGSIPASDAAPRPLVFVRPRR